jgi:hypothetical protein
MKSTRIEPPAKRGGDYWIISFSAICNSYRQNDLEIIDQKIKELKEKATNSPQTISKNMYQKNISNLQIYKSLDLKSLRPAGKLSFLKKSSGHSLLTIKGLEIQAKPSQIFTFGNKEVENIEAIWFVAKANVYRIEELGMFCEMLYRFLRSNHSKKYELVSRYAIAVDIVSGRSSNYADIEVGALSPLITPTLDEINRFM